MTNERTDTHSISSGHLLITGATGYLGRALLTCVVPFGFSKVTGVLRDRSLAPDINGVHWITYSELMNDPGILLDVDIICHLAVPRGGNNEAELAKSVNDLRRILNKASNSGVSGFMFASSQAVYGVSELPWIETAVPAPITSHGWAKLACEHLVLSAQNTTPTMRCINVRIPKVIGPGTRFRMNLGEHVHSLAFAALNKKVVRLNSSFMRQKFDFIDLRDTASILHEIARRSPDNWPNILNIGNGKLIDGAQLVAMINEVSIEKYSKSFIFLESPDNKKKRDFGMDVRLFNSIFDKYIAREMRQTISDVFDFLNYQSRLI